MTQKAAEFDRIAHIFARYRDDTDGRRLVVNHTDGSFIGNECRNSRSRRAAGNGNHIQTDGADAGHSFQFFQAQAAPAYGFQHAFIFTDRNECTRQATDTA